MIRPLLGAIAVLLTLSGCVTAVSAPAPGLSAAEEAAVRQLVSDSVWESLGLSSELRPPDPPVVVVSPEDWVGEFSSCMNDAGFENYLESQGAMSSGQGQSQDEQLAVYRCSVGVSVDYGETGFLNHAQRDYWYDYFGQVLVPCLVDHGVDVLEAPTRAEFQEGFGDWNPYWAIGAVDQDRVYGDTQLQTECPFAPPGVPDPGYFG